jgi:sigma-E factor negative regulatory protein RseA
MMEKIENREIVSALADGQLHGEALARGVELAATDAAAREAWQAYHLIGDVLRSDDLAQCTHPGVFLDRLQARLHRESVTVTPDIARMPAANDGNFRWKLVAGLASITAIAAISWAAIGVSTARPEGAQLAVVPSGTVLAKSERGMMIRDPRLDELMAAHRQLGGAALVAPAGFLRNATFDGQAH